jgi:diguanylate cyclase (GGDEF)-like protein/PAS domain S-box-containing protein
MDSNSKHFELLQNLHTAVVVHRPDTSIVYCNRRAEELLSLSVDQLLGKTAMDPTWRFVDEFGRDLPIHQYPVNRVLGTLTSLEEMIVGVRSADTKNHTWLLVSAFPDFFSDGKLKQVVVNFYSIQKRKAIEAKLANTAAELDDLYNNSPCGYFSLDSTGKFLHVNDTALNWLGATRDQVIGKRTAVDFLPDYEKLSFLKRFEHFRSTGYVDNVEVDLIGLNGILRRVALTATAVYDEKGTYQMSRSAIYDLTALHHTKIELEQLHREQEAMLDNEMIGIVKLHERTAIWQNKALGKIFGYSFEELVGKSSRILYHSEEQFETLGKAAYPILAQGGTYRTQLEMRHKNGSAIWIDLSGVRLSVEQKTSMWMLADISELKAYQRKVEEMAYYDALTGLPNRSLFDDRLKQIHAISAREQTQYAVCYLDLDGFKSINDTYGHAYGDAVLKEVGARLKENLRSFDTACRIGGDEFAILTSHAATAEDYLFLIERVLQEIRKPIAINRNISLSVGCSIGVAIFPLHSVFPDVLLQYADRAMYTAKNLGRNRVQLFVLPSQV